ncbi:MAG: chromosome segregation protein SMC [Acidobacteria bacterium]|nr:chromosome segregation protein SMC [Acidobacteriota bacterium]
MKAESSQEVRFVHLALENWRNFSSVDVDLASRIFLVGPNASGKSNLLDVFRFLHDIVVVGGGFQEAIRRRRGVTSLRCLAARRYPDIAVQVSLGSESGVAAWEYELRFTQDNLRRPVIRKEKVTSGGKVILDRPDEEDRADPARLTQTNLEQLNVNRRFRDVADLFGSVRYLHIVPQLVREPDRSAGHQLDPYGGDFLEQVARTPEKTRNARLRRISAAMSLAVPQLQELELWRDVRGIPHLRGKYEHWRPQGAWQMEEDFSDGTLRLLGLLWATLDGAGPLLLEEPELSLHPEVVGYLPQMLARMQGRTGRQVFLSTHSPEILRDQGIGLDELLLLVPAREGTTVSPASSFKEIPELLKGGLSLADAALPRTRPKNVRQLSLFGD